MRFSSKPIAEIRMDIGSEEHGEKLHFPAISVNALRVVESAKKQQTRAPITSEFCDVTWILNSSCCPNKPPETPPMRHMKMPFQYSMFKALRMGTKERTLWFI